MAFFKRALFEFLMQLEAHNDREWFNANKPRYESALREPALAFIRALGPRIRQLSPHFSWSDKRMGGSLMRIYRDVRFGKDKRPYKTNVGIHFRHSAGKDVHAPGWYVHLSPAESFMAMGLWRPDGPALARIRAAIDSQGERWRGIVDDKAFSETWTRSSEDTLKRPPKGYDKAHPLIADLKLKSHTAMAPLDADALLSDDLVDHIMAAYEQGADYARFLCDAVGQPF